MLIQISLLLIALLQSLQAGAIVRFQDISGEDLLTGKPVSVAKDLSNKKGLVVIFMSAKCPNSDSHLPEIKKIASLYKNFQFVAIHSNEDEPKELSKAYFEKAELPFAVIEDEKMKLADAFKAFKTPHTFLLSPQEDILYQGGITNSADAKKADQHYLENALENVSNGKAVTVAEGRTLGCVILRKAEQNAW